MIYDHDDALDDIFGDLPAAQIKAERNDALMDMTVAHATRRVYRENCTKCGGSGVYRGYSSRGHKCFECDGVGFKEFKTAPDVRAKHRLKAAEKRQQKVNVLAERASRYHAEHPEVSAWLLANAKTADDFASSLLGAIDKYGHLTERQEAAVERCIARDAERKAEWARQDAARAAAAPAVSIAAVEASLANAKASGIQFPKLRLADFVFSPAGASSANAGSIYVKTRDGDYLGKIQNGKFLKVRACTDEQEAEVVEVASDPKQAAIAYGRRTGSCSCCGRTLTNHASIELGIGPICAEKFGW